MKEKDYFADVAECGGTVEATMTVVLSDGFKVQRKALAPVASLTLEEFAAAIAAGGAKDSSSAAGNTKTKKLQGRSEIPASQLAAEKSLKLWESAVVEIDA